ncbi:hypothetical protein ABIE73_000018 [Bradyrhizobium yuanmingense]
MNDRKASHLKATACQRYTGKTGSETKQVMALVGQ